jgi:cobaltochelatase CobT
VTVRTPIAFLSYVRDDDAHDFGSVTKFRERLEGEVKLQTGKRFEIFQDRNDIRWGQLWKERIDDSLGDATFLIPILTPSFFASPACRAELDTFLRMERTLGVTKLILPIYYVTCDEVEPNSLDAHGAELKARNWTDWRDFRFKPFESHEVRSAIAVLAKNIKGWTVDLASIAEAADFHAQPTNPQRKSEQAILTSAILSHKPRNPPWSKAGFLDRSPPAGETYWTYTLDFDEVIHAKELLGDSEESATLLKELSTQIARVKRANLKRLNETSQYIAAGDGVAVTVLCDNSGSMRGKRVTAVAVWACIVSNILDACGVQHEILGYTTRSWKGGMSREQWLAGGRTLNPGRLCDLRHIVYKSFTDSANDVMTNCATMMRQGLLKENIDGEALLWASGRLEDFAAKKKLMFVITDGSPVDDSTISTNTSLFLDKHLRQVAGWIDNHSEIALCAIGIDAKAIHYVDSTLVSETNIGLPIIQRVVGAIAERSRFP